MNGEVNPEHILEVGFGFWASKTLLTAVELGVFTVLAKGSRDAAGLQQDLALHPRGMRDFVDALVSLGLLECDGDQYRNTPATEMFLDRAKPSYIGGILEMANTRLYPFWAFLTQALQSGRPQNETKTGEYFFDTLYADPDRLQQFLAAMSGISMGTAQALAEQFPWDRYQSVIDIGGAEGCLPVQLALRHAHLRGGEFDLPAVGPHFDAYVSSFGLTDRLRFYPGDFWADPLPSADVLVFGHILHDWGLDEKLTLLRSAYQALPPDGALIVYDAMIDDQRKHNTFGLLMSLNMLIETEAGFDYTGADCHTWMQTVGFQHTHVQHLAGPDSMVVAIK